MRLINFQQASAPKIILVRFQADNPSEMAWGKPCKIDSPCVDENNNGKVNSVLGFVRRCAVYWGLIGCCYSLLHIYTGRQ